MKPRSIESIVPGDGIEDLLPAQCELIEAELERQESAMKTRVSAASTRSAVLIGASAFLAGAEFASSSWSALTTGAALGLYLAATVLGLISARSRVGREPALARVVAEYAAFATISMRRELILGRLRSHALAVRNLGERHTLLVVGFWLLAAAWALAATGSVLDLIEEASTQEMEMHVVD